ncbi:MAG: PDZ domain-containing protein [Phycisphaerae bacterium]|nr:PDZ domain-containing protein [Phycisphaerae bacterium]MCZ2400646.1 PDZ domain-containing protein [Phycisphaerae bacterium]NUQ50548.1 PDZ domain-containing protein [Phycisphaerae bacterium]
MTTLRKTHLGAMLAGALLPAAMALAIDHPGLFSPRAHGPMGDEQEAPAVWIGVRLSPVPEALAAHVGGNGLMILNVASGSPADQAGLVRYDVLLSVDGRALSQMSDLVEVISQAGTTRPIALTVLHEGKQRVVKLTPAARPADDSYSFKYDDPESQEDATRYFGHKLRRDDQGNWIFEPLGRLRELPDAVRDLNSPAWRQWMGSFRQWQQDPFQFRLRVDPDMGMFFFDGDDASETGVSICVTVDSDGQRTTVERHADGSITVTRADAGGQESVTQYANADELKEKDPAAYETYRRYAGFRQRRMITVTPELKDLQRNQQQWRQELSEALERLGRDAAENVRRAEELREHLLREGAGAGRGGQSGTVTRRSFMSSSATVDDQGRIRIRIERDGKVETHEFRDQDEFRTAQPELYEQYRWLFDGATRGQAGAATPVTV